MYDSCHSTLFIFYFCMMCWTAYLKPRLSFKSRSEVTIVGPQTEKHCYEDNSNIFNIDPKIVHACKHVCFAVLCSISCSLMVSLLYLIITSCYFPSQNQSFLYWCLSLSQKWETSSSIVIVLL